MKTLILALTSCLALACADDGAAAPDDGFPLEPLATVSGALADIELRTGPTQPPVRGVLEAELLVNDGDGAPLAGLTLAVTPWMPAMNHGTSRVAAVHDMGGGVYHVTNVGCAMAGLWVLRTQVTFGDGQRETFELPMQVR